MSAKKFIRNAVNFKKKPTTLKKEVKLLKKEVGALMKSQRGFSIFTQATAVNTIDNGFNPGSTVPTAIYPSFAQGDAPYQRQGDTVQITRWRIRYSIDTAQGVNVSGAGTTSIKTRVLIVRIKRPNGDPSVPGGTLALTIGDIIDPNDALLTYDYMKTMSDVPSLRQKGNIEILDDKLFIHTVNQNWVAADKASMDRTHSEHTFVWKPKSASAGSMSFNGNLSTLADVESGVLAVLAYSDFSSGSAENPVLHLHSQIEFEA